MPSPSTFDEQEDDDSLTGCDISLGCTLALDVGDRRIGIALSDPLGQTARPLLTLYRSTLRADLKSIARLIRKHSVAKIIIGLPLHEGGEMSPQAHKTQTFAGQLSQANPAIYVHLLDERLTTLEAHDLLERSRSVRRGRRGRVERSKVIDQIAAILLLEAYLSLSSPSLLPNPKD